MPPKKPPRKHGSLADDAEMPPESSPELSSASNNGDSESEDEGQYCICGEGESGQMIACENESCERQWFHLDCVGLSKAPRKTTKWYCPDCRTTGAASTAEGTAARPTKKLKLTLSNTKVLAQSSGGKYAIKAATDPESGGKKTKICENAKCSKEIAANEHTGRGPDNELLCGTCRSRHKTAKRAKISLELLRAPDARWRVSAYDTSRFHKATDESGKLMCQNPKHVKEVGVSTGRGPDNEVLCGACYHRYRKAVNSAPPGHAIDFSAPDAAWREPPPRRGGPNLKIPVDEDGKERCQNHRCRNEIEPGDHRHKGTNGEIICKSCEQRYRRAKNAHKKDKSVDLTSPNAPWRFPGKKNPRMHEKLHVHHCDDCGTEELAEENDLCDYCQQRVDAGAPVRPHANTIRDRRFYQHVELVRLAAENWRLRHNNIDLFVNENPPLPEFSTDDYWSLSHGALKSLARKRGMLIKEDEQQLFHFINDLQINDAYNGLIPRPVPQSATQHHAKHSEVLIEDARKRGYLRGKPRTVPQDKTTLINWMEQWDDRSDVFKPVDETQTEIIRILVADLNASLRGSDVNHLQTSTHVTFNQGMFGNEQVLNRLQDAIETDQLLPTQTSGARLLCGPNALSMTLDAVRRIMRERHLERDYHDPSERHISAHEMMEILFTNYDRTRMAGDDEIGEPTAEYQAYLDEFTSHLDDHAIVQQEQLRMRSLNNLHAEQLQAILAMLRLHERLIDDYGFGVVIGAHFDDNGNFVPSHATVLYDGDGSSPIVWLHNHRALGDALLGEGYDHWEGFTRDGRMDAAYDWGLRLPFVGLRPSMTYSRANPANNPLTTEQRIRADISAVQTKIGKLRNTLRTMCLPCRSKQHSVCIAQPGKACTSCIEDDKTGMTCKWPSHLSFPVIHYSAKGLTAEDLLSWELPIKNLEEFTEIPKEYKSAPIPEEPHFAALFFGRMSSHGGLQRLNDIFVSLQQTSQHYDNMLNQQHQQHIFEFMRPTLGAGGPTLPMHARLYPIARHGVRKVPIQFGNLNDPFLIDFVRYLHTITDPNNQNRPREIHIVLLGLAGFSVDITGFGDFIQGFLAYLSHWDRVNGTALATNTFLVPLVEEPVIDGNTDVSLPGPGVYNAGQLPPALRLTPHPPAPYWVGYHRKFLQRVRLIHMVTRWDTRKLHLFSNLANNMQQQVPSLGFGAVYDDKLDRVTDAMWEEMAWRSGWLNDAPNPTVPSATAVFGRNNNRNLPMR